MKFGMGFLVFFAVNLWASGLTTSLVSGSLTGGRPADLAGAVGRGSRICSAGSLGFSIREGVAERARYETWDRTAIRPLMLLGDQQPPEWPMPTPRTFPGAYAYPEGLTHFPGNIFGLLDAMDAGVCEVAVAGANARPSSLAGMPSRWSRASADRSGPPSAVT